MKKEESNSENTCCSPNSSCCAPSDLKTSDNDNSSTEETQKSYDPTKVHLDIFVPLNECACLWDQFMNKVFEVITPYMKHITFSTQNIYSEEARHLKVQSKSVVINGGEKRFTSPFTLQKELPRILSEKGII